jgi:hypothetical protein
MTMNNEANTSDNTNSAPAVEQEQAHRFRAGFQRVEALVRAVPEDDLELINLDIPSVVATVIGAYPEIAEFRSVMAELPMFDIKNVDNLRDYACALGYTYVDNRAAMGPVDHVADQAAELVGIREQYLADATALAKRDLLSQEVVDKHRGGNSYKMIAFDVLGLVKVFEDHWDKIESKCALTKEDLDRSTGLANALVEAVGHKEQAAPAVNEVSLLRQQAYTVLVRAYNEVREALMFIRRGRGDVDAIAPSLWAGRGKRTAPEADPTPPVVVQTAPGLAALAEPRPAKKEPVGFPGSDPLTN